MRHTANVRSIDAIRAFRAALGEFIEEGTAALSEVDADLKRTMSWLENDQRRFWERQIRKRAEKVAQAKNELYRAKLAVTEGRPDCIQEEKALRRAQQRQEEAEQKVAATRQWCRLLSREILLYKGQCQALAGALAGDLPRGVERLKKHVASLEAYLQVAAPAADLPPSAADTSDHSRTPSESPSTERPPHPLRQAMPDRAQRDRLPLTETALLIGAPATRVHVPHDLIERLGAHSAAPGPEEKVVIAPGILREERIVLHRASSAAPGDSGWYLSGDRPDVAPDDLQAMRCSSLLKSRPDLGPLLALPPGFLAVVNGAELERVLDARDEQVWPQIQNVPPTPARQMPEGSAP